MRTLKQVLKDLEIASFTPTTTNAYKIVFTGAFGCKVTLCKDNVIKFDSVACYETDLIELFLEYLQIWNEGE